MLCIILSGCWVLNYYFIITYPLVILGVSQWFSKKIKNNIKNVSKAAQCPTVLRSRYFMFPNVQYKIHPWFKFNTPSLRIREYNEIRNIVLIHSGFCWLSLSSWICRSILLSNGHYHRVWSLTLWPMNLCLLFDYALMLQLPMCNISTGDSFLVLNFVWHLGQQCDAVTLLHGIEMNINVWLLWKKTDFAHIFLSCQCFIYTNCKQITPVVFIYYLFI